MHAASRAIARAFDLGGDGNRFAVGVERLDGAALLEQVGDMRRVADGRDLHSLRVEIAPRGGLHLQCGHCGHTVGV